MRTYPSSFFRRAVIPWYDSNAAIALLVIVMDIVAVFAVLGIREARRDPEWAAHVWVPALLLGLCILVLISASWRWASRYPSEHQP